MQEALNGRVTLLAVVVIFSPVLLFLHHNTQPRIGCGRDRNRTRGKGSKQKAAERYFGGKGKDWDDKGKGKSKGDNGKGKSKYKGKGKGYDRALGVTRLVLVIFFVFHW